jgi:hypothetical protein
MKYLLPLITLLIMVSPAEAKTRFFYVDQKLIDAAYEGFACQLGLGEIQERLRQDDEQEDNNKKMRPSGRQILERCREKLLRGEKSDFSDDLNKSLLGVLVDPTPARYSRCRKGLLTLILEKDDIKKWVPYLANRSANRSQVEDKLRTKISVALEDARTVGDCMQVSKS